MLLNQDELTRYARHFALPEIGIAGQEKLKQAKILCVGAGGLGSAAIGYLAAAGVGTLGIVDNDRVELSNLQRQIIHGYSDIGQPKVYSALQWIKNNNPEVKVNLYDEYLTANNAESIISQYELVIDGSDNFATRYLINDACYFTKKPNIHASVFRFDGQLSVFCVEGGSCYRCLFPEIPENIIPNCVESGVLGVLPGLLGVLQATEALKLIIGCGNPLINSLLTVNVLDMQFNTLTLSKNPSCALCGENSSIKYLNKVKLTLAENGNDINDLFLQIKQNPQIKLFDVREPYELIIKAPLKKAINIPLNEIPNNLELFPKNETFVVYCKSGSRSQLAVHYLREKGFDCLNLKGGIDAWQQLN